jgi:tetratricopeptide (TPR) repeat protein
MAIALSEMQYELQPYNIELLRTLIDVYNDNFLLAKAGDAIEKLNTLVTDYPDYQFMQAHNYLLSNKLNEGLKYIKKRVEENPGYAGFHLKQGQFYLHQGDLDNAEITFKNAILQAPELEVMWLFFLDHINFARSHTIVPGDLQKFVGRYRIELGELSYDTRIYNDHLFCEPANQLGRFMYPMSDTIFIAYAGEGIYIGSNFQRNGQGKVYKVTESQSNHPNPYHSWKQDKLIIDAERLLESGKPQDALIAFRKAYAENPEHYYLANYIKHLEYLHSQGFKEGNAEWESYAGRYGTSKIFYKNDHLFVEPYLSMPVKILPMSEVQFMIPSSYFRTMEFVKENNQIVGVRVFLADGREFFIEKASDN